jgi:hypothetical protein
MATTLQQPAAVKAKYLIEIMALQIKQSKQPVNDIGFAACGCALVCTVIASEAAPDRYEYWLQVGKEIEKFM